MWKRRDRLWSPSSSTFLWLSNIILSGRRGSGTAVQVIRGRANVLKRCGCSLNRLGQVFRAGSQSLPGKDQKGFSNMLPSLLSPHSGGKCRGNSRPVSVISGRCSCSSTFWLGLLNAVTGSEGERIPMHSTRVRL